MAACSSCRNQTKYVCIACDTPICNREDCSIPESNEESVGWIPQRSVAYCKLCGDEENRDPWDLPNSSSSMNRKRRMKQNSDINALINEELKSRSSYDSTSDESDLDLQEPKLKAAKKARGQKGRRGSWKESHIDDMIDIIVNNDNYKKKLVFTNLKKQKNSEVYGSILKELNTRYSKHEPPTTFPFNIMQMRTKFKWCVSTCKKMCMTIPTATGIKRVQDEKGFGKWFDLLYPLIKSRDSCQPEQALEPTTMSDCENNTSGDSLFVPIKSSAAGKKKDKATDLLLESVNALKQVIENDPTKDILTLMREDMIQAREQEKQFQQMLLAVLQQPSSWLHPNQSSHTWPGNVPPAYENVSFQPCFDNRYGITPDVATNNTPTSNNLFHQTSEFINMSSTITNDFQRNPPSRFEKL